MKQIKSKQTIVFATVFVLIASMTVMHADNASAQTTNLYVSADNPTFQNRMTGPQVVEVVIRDSDISDTGKGLGEPDVTVNGKDLRMIQAVDGNWYGYFAEPDTEKALTLVLYAQKIHQY